MRMKILGCIAVAFLVVAVIGHGIFGLGWLESQALKVDAAALQSIRASGNVVAEAEASFAESDSMIVTHYLVFDSAVDRHDLEVSQVAAALEVNGWKVVARLPSLSVQLEAERWGMKLLTLERLDPADPVLDEKVRSRISEAIVGIRND
ncbi:hypothetical protein [Nonomuraea longicatena]|uniref:Secreted protein n=1 Tax=Nonomuraea longicatena TaxID=83682 RepID=A0ABN1NP04_9ACTN